MRPTPAIASALARSAVVVGVLVVLAGAAVGVSALRGGPSSAVTRARLERAVPVVFANLYTDRARLLGRRGVTPASLHVEAMCDKRGSGTDDVGPGEWTCLMSWVDSAQPMPPEGYGSFQVAVRSNGCFTADAPTRLAGFATLTTADGTEVTNPAFEFDGCFDPGADDAPTGVAFPSVLGVASTSVTPDAAGRIGLALLCGAGSDGCRGYVTARAGSTALGTVPFDLAEESTGGVRFTIAVPRGARQVTLQVQAAAGYISSSPFRLPVQQG